jgi:hypothetical protein
MRPHARDQATGMAYGAWGSSVSSCVQSRPSGCPPAMPSRPLWLGLICLALVACARQHVTVAPAPLEDVAAIPTQVDPHLWTLNECWAAGGTSGAAPVGTVLRQVLVDDPQAPLRLTYVTSQLDVRTVVSPTFYRPHAHEARYRLSVRVESPAAGARQVRLEGAGRAGVWRARPGRPTMRSRRPCGHSTATSAP